MGEDDLYEGAEQDGPSPGQYLAAAADETVPLRRRRRPHRTINRLRAQLLEYRPALEQAFDYAASRAALVC